MPEPKGKKKKGLKPGQWLLMGAVVGGVFYLYYKRKQAAAKSASDTIGTLPNQMPGGAGSQTTKIGDGGNGPITKFNSLQEWMAHVQSWANTLGFDPASVQSALQKYSIGTCLSATEYHIIDMALGLFGQPPNAPYQGVVQCQPGPTPTAPATEPFLGSGYGPPGYDQTQFDPATNQQKGPPTPTEQQVIHGLDGNCYLWLANPNASGAAGGSGQPVYIEVAPHFFVPQLSGVPTGTAAQYVRTTCPAPSGAF